jgi:hypothetical protein
MNIILHLTIHQWIRVERCKEQIGFFLVFCGGDQREEISVS